MMTKKVVRILDKLLRLTRRQAAPLQSQILRTPMRLRHRSRHRYKPCSYRPLKYGICIVIYRPTVPVRVHIFAPLERACPIHKRSRSAQTDLLVFSLDQNDPEATTSFRMV